MCCVIPAGAGDVVDKSLRLQTVDGSPFDCYGRVQLTVKIGRKQYHIPAVKAKVKSPILGWDFVDKYKLDTVWGQFGDLFLRDKKAKIQKRLEHVVVPHKTVPKFEAVTMRSNIAAFQNSEILNFGAKCVNAVAPSLCQLSKCVRFFYVVLQQRARSSINLSCYSLF